MSPRKKGLIALICTVVLVAGALLALHLTEPRTEDSNDLPSAEARNNAETNGALSSYLVDWNGKRYRKNYNVETLLLIGYDKDVPLSELELKGYQDGGCSDFLLLVVIDHGKEEIRMCQLDRDTMTPIHTLSELGGRPQGTKVLNIALSHCYGKDLAACDRNTVTAVLDLMDHAWVDRTISMNIAGIPAINHLLGGVEMVIPEDLTDLIGMELPEELGSVDAAETSVLTAGNTVKLTDRQAVLVTRTRMQAGDGRNVSRMARQKEFMKAAAKQMQAMVAQDSSFASTLVDGVADIATMDMSQGWIVNTLVKTYNYTVREPYIPASTHTSRLVYRTSLNEPYEIEECYVDEEDLTRWVMENLYVEYGT